MWRKFGASEVLSQSSSFSVVNVSRPGTPDNMIQYQCTASNGVETPAIATVNVTVHCKYKSVLLFTLYQTECEYIVPECELHWCSNLLC